MCLAPATVGGCRPSYRALLPPPQYAACVSSSSATAPGGSCVGLWTSPQCAWCPSRRRRMNVACLFFATAPGGSSVGLSGRRRDCRCREFRLVLVFGVFTASPRESREREQRELRRSELAVWQSLAELDESFPGGYFSSHSDHGVEFGPHDTIRGPPRVAGAFLPTKGTL
ncbi:hypothetical protein THAOC_37551 [Thalassiosira oceanica]|uniref:Uncharacterized protein n=1 Tax=Thalassiosira oceanica TaxID=159749 RepID=K0R5R9_THAOC|nr:hypothetical protein THAOC_37551 [Thalassiosira oceanica]|eukprot:EJK43956.1 hypothetical protein THAOC_37551 [Thalassiosira oceanica]